jgi:hypothetical protein
MRCSYNLNPRKCTVSKEHPYIVKPAHCQPRLDLHN